MYAQGVLRYTCPADDTRASESFLFPLLPPAATIRAVCAARAENPFKFSALSWKFSSRPGVPAQFQQKNSLDFSFVLFVFNSNGLSLINLPPS